MMVYVHVHIHTDTQTLSFVMNKITKNQRNSSYRFTLSIRERKRKSSIGCINL